MATTDTTTADELTDQRISTLGDLREIFPDLGAAELTDIADWALEGRAPLGGGLDATALESAAYELAQGCDQEWSRRENQARFRGLAQRTIVAYLNATQ